MLLSHLPYYTYFNTQNSVFGKYFCLWGKKIFIVLRVLVKKEGEEEDRELSFWGVMVLK